MAAEQQSKPALPPGGSAPAAGPMDLSADDVGRLLAARFPDAAGMSLPWVIGPTYVSRNSRIFRAECSGFDMPLAVKFCRDADDARAQYEALARVDAAMAHGAGFDVPRPVALIEESRAVIIEWIAGSSVERDLLNWRLSPRRAALSLDRSGAWLRCFHDAASTGTGPFDTRIALVRLGESLAGCTSATPGMAAIRRAVAVLEGTAATVAVTPLPVGWMHSDFKPANVMLAGPRTVGIDIQGRFRDVAVRDQAYFLTHLDLACYHPRGLRLLPWRRRLAAAFLDGYGWSRDGWPSEPLLWMRLHTMIRIWAGFATSTRNRVRKFYLMRCCEMVISDLSRRLAADLD